MILLNLLFPRRCVSCGKVGGYFCKRCLTQIDYIVRPICPICTRPAIDGATHLGCKTKYTLDGMYVTARYRGPMRKAIHQFKYKLVSDIADNLIENFFSLFPKYLLSLDFFIPVPLHKKKERERGFNQSVLLCESMEKKFNIPVRHNILRRNRNTPPQVGLEGKDRCNNVKGAFSYNGSINISDKSIGLIDDVATTRSTLLECARVLKGNGAKRVWGIVLAHG